MLEIQTEPPLPPLRQELRMEPGAPLVNGAPSWTIFDPIRHLFYQIGELEMRILSLWPGRTVSAVSGALVQDGYDEASSNAAIGRMIEFCFTNSLTRSPPGEAVKALMERRNATKREWWRWMLDNYLFIRVPLVRPAKFLERTLTRVAPLWSPLALIFFAICALTGLVLVARQWDVFVQYFLYFFSVEGAIAYALALSLVKIAHELGHAYTATRFGCRVPTMGVSFLVMMPVLYTDTTAAWRLRSRRERLLIDCAGVAAELMIASIATLLWVFLPDGVVRSVAYVLATTGWVTSLVLNLNPLMRFDGYYLLSDWLGVPNLQPRAFAIGRWWVREKLFALGEAPPEQMPSRLRAYLIVYVFVNWVYRFMLYLGIALLVYHMFFKALGVLLFAVEMTVFIIRPIWGELRAWRERGPAIARSGRYRIWLWGLGVVALLLVLPLDRHIDAPAVLVPIGDAPLVAGEAARIETIHIRNGQTVAAGAPIATLVAPEIERLIAQHRVTLVRIEAQLGRSAADAEDRSNRTILESEQLAERDALRGLEARRERLVLRAPIAGRIVDLDPDTHAGRWLNGSEVIARIITPGRYDVQAYVAENDAWRIEAGARGRFVPKDAGQSSRRVRLVERAGSATGTIDIPILASTQGGPIAVAEEPGGRLKPRHTLYRTRLVAESGGPQDVVDQIVPGNVVIAARPESVVAQIVRWSGRIYAREASLSD
jgi:putative peptide zinc metalloprotease protein